MARNEIWGMLKQNFMQEFGSDRARFMQEAIDDDDGGWTKHTEFHWSRTVAGHKLDFWPSRKKWQYRGKIRRGNVYEFIKRKVAA